MTHDMINLIKELKTLIELLRERLTNLTIKPHAESDSKKNLQPQTNEAEDSTKKTNQTTNPNIDTITTKPNNLPTKKN